MEVIKILIPMAIIMGIVFVGFFIWSTKTGQFDDLDTPSKRILLDDENENSNKKKSKDNSEDNLTHERKEV